MHSFYYLISVACSVTSFLTVCTFGFEPRRRCKACPVPSFHQALRVSASAVQVKNAFIQWCRANTVHWSRLFDTARVCSVREGTRHFHCARKCGAVGRVIATAVDCLYVTWTARTVGQCSGCCCMHHHVNKQNSTFCPQNLCICVH
jgi:hypothetical protein